MATVQESQTQRIHCTALFNFVNCKSFYGTCNWRHKKSKVIPIKWQKKHIETTHWTSFSVQASGTWYRSNSLGFRWSEFDDESEFRFDSSRVGIPTWERFDWFNDRHHSFLLFACNKGAVTSVSQTLSSRRYRSRCVKTWCAFNVVWCEFWSHTYQKLDMILFFCGLVRIFCDFLRVCVSHKSCACFTSFMSEMEQWSVYFCDDRPSSLQLALAWQSELILRGTDVWTQRSQSVFLLSIAQDTC